MNQQSCLSSFSYNYNVFGVQRENEDSYLVDSVQQTLDWLEELDDPQFMINCFLVLPASHLYSIMKAVPFPTTPTTLLGQMAISNCYQRCQTLRMRRCNSTETSALSLKS